MNGAPVSADLQTLIRGWIQSSDLTLVSLHAGLEQRGVSVSLSLVKRWSAGSRTPRPWDLATLMDVLDIPPDERELARDLVFQRPEAA